MKSRLHIILFFGIAVILSMTVSLTGEVSSISDNSIDEIRVYDVGDYFVSAKSVNSDYEISSKLKKAFEYADVSVEEYGYCLELIENCNVNDTDCSINDLSNCLIKESVINFNAVRNGKEPYACPSCPRHVKIRNEFDRGDYDVSLVEKIRKLQIDEDQVGICYQLLKGQCHDKKCPLSLIEGNCLNHDDALEFFNS